MLIHAATTLENMRKGLVRGITAEAVVECLKAGEKLCFVDVREAEEVVANPFSIEGTKLIPLGELRDNLKNIPVDSLIITVCELGTRGYEAACLLQGKGFHQVAFLQGGLSVWNAYSIPK